MCIDFRGLNQCTIKTNSLFLILMSYRTNLVESLFKDSSSIKLLPSQLIKVECEDTYCQGCVENMIEIAIKDETAYPPSCCGCSIVPRKIQKHISKPLIRRFEEKEVEYSTKDRTYCHRPKCSAFIAPHSIHMLISRGRVMLIRLLRRSGSPELRIQACLAVQRHEKG